MNIFDDKYDLSADSFGVMNRVQRWRRFQKRVVKAFVVVIERDVAKSAVR
jgi:hypothetical protein